jgi:hypothetical protein
VDPLELGSRSFVGAIADQDVRPSKDRKVRASRPTARASALDLVDLRLCAVERGQPGEDHV